MSDEVPTPIGKMWMADGVLWHRVEPGATVDAAAAREVTRVANELTGGQRVPAVVDIRGVAFAERDARDLFAREGDVVEAATVLVVTPGTPGAAMAELWRKHSRPSRPVEVVFSVEEAAEWAARHR